MAPSGKRKKLKVDRLSGLPDSLLIHVLSLMDTRFAVQTSILSTRYKQLWTFVPNLSFNSENFRKLSSFDKFISHVIKHHDDQFKVSSLSYVRNGNGSKPIKRVLNYSISHRIEYLKVSGCMGKIGGFVSSIFTCKSLKTLHLENCMIDVLFSKILKLPIRFSLPCLTTLYLENVLFGRSDMGNNVCLVLFSKCPNLKNITLVGCKICVHVKIFRLVCPQVQNFSFKLVDYEVCRAKVVLIAPKLINFNIECHLPINLCFNSRSSLEVANIGGRVSSTGNEIALSLIHMFKKFSNLKVVTISSFDLIRVLSKFPSLLENLPSPFLNLKSLKLKVYHEDITSTMLDKVISFLLNSSADASVVVESL